MSLGQGLLTEDERNALAGGQSTIERTTALESVYDRIEAIERDLELLAETEPQLFEEILNATIRMSQSEEALSPVNDSTEQTLGELGFSDGTEKGKAAVFAARDYIRANGEATRRELVKTIMPIYPLTYDVSDAHRQGEAEGESNEWFKEIIEPGLEALPDVEPVDNDQSWYYAE